MADKERVRVQAGRGGAPREAGKAMAIVQKGDPFPVAAAPTTLYQAIIQAARDPTIDADKMKTLVDLQMQVEANEARKAFTRAFNALQEELPIINKDGIIDHGEGTTAKGNKKLKTKWATYPNIMRICGPLLKKHGFTLSNVIEPAADISRIVVVGYLEHIEGHSRISRFPLGVDASGGKNNNQGWGSSQQYGMRYNAIALLNIVSEAREDLDNDGFKRKGSDVGSQLEILVTDEQAAKVREAVQTCGVGLEKFCAKFGVESISDLSASKFNDAIRACKNYAQEIEKRTAKPVKGFPGDR